MLKRVFLSRDYLTLIPLLAVAAYCCMTCIIQIWNRCPEGSVAWYLTFCKTCQGWGSMILGLRASAVNAARSLGSSGCCFSCVHKKACIGKEVISVLLQVTIVGTLIHQSGINTLSQGLFLLLLILRLILFWIWKIARRNHKSTFVWRGGSLFVGREKTYSRRMWFLVRQERWVCLERISESVILLLSNKRSVVTSTKLRYFEEVVCQRILYNLILQI